MNKCKNCKRFISSNNNKKFCSSKCRKKHAYNACLHYIEQQKEKGCCKCRYNKCLDALHFHHKNPTKKIAKINKIRKTGNLNKVKAEIQKCILVCANCHAELHKKEKI